MRVDRPFGATSQRATWRGIFGSSVERETITSGEPTISRSSVRGSVSKLRQR
jgi:hypothetical protein